MEKPQGVALSDIITYTPETYFKEDELELIRAHFNGPDGAKLLKVVRKAILPSISDPDLPVEEMSKDMFMSAVDFRIMPDSEVKPAIMGLQLAAKIMAGALIQLKNLATIAPEDAKNRAARREKDSAK